jgi:hypothetical protein
MILNPKLNKTLYVNNTPRYNETYFSHLLFCAYNYENSFKLVTHYTIKLGIFNRHCNYKHFKRGTGYVRND